MVRSSKLIVRATTKDAAVLTTFHRFLDLPPELRFMVCRFAFRTLNRIPIVIVDPEDEKKDAKIRMAKAPIPGSLSSTCRLVYQESSPFLIDGLHFFIARVSKRHSLRAWYSENIKHTSLEFGLIDPAFLSIAQRMRRGDLSFLRNRSIDPPVDVSSLHQILEPTSYCQHVRSFGIVIFSYQDQKIPPQAFEAQLKYRGDAFLMTNDHPKSVNVFRKLQGV